VAATAAASPEPAMPRAGLPGWLVALTFVCIALFVAGLVVYLRRDGGAGPTGQAAAPDEVIVHRADGTPWFRVGARPITAAAYREVFPRHDQPSRPDDAVILVTYNEARSFVATRGGRLLTAEEWDSAAVTPGVRLADDLLEWVESPDGNNRIVRGRGQRETRPDKPHKDVTFRMARQP
jgi:hypothetical protein